MSKDIRVDGGVFSKEAVLSTAYWCADKMVADITCDGKDFVVHISGRGGCELQDADIDGFRAMLVHNQMRHQLSERFAELETAIVNKAFSPVRNRQE